MLAKNVRRRVVIPGLLALTGLCFARPCRAADAVKYEPADVLSTADVGGQANVFQTGSWGQPQEEQGRSFRIYPGKDAPARVAIKPWWKEGDSPGEDAILAFTFKDTVRSPMIVLGWNAVGGLYGYNYVGQFGGADDGQWKQGLLFVSRRLIARQRDGWSIHFWGAGAMPIQRIDVIKVSAQRKQAAIGQARAARQAHVEAMKKVFAEDPWKQTGELGEVAEQFRQTGFIPYVRSYNRDVYPGSIPAAQERGAGPLQAYATPGEFEPIQVAAFALKDVTLEAAVTDLTGPGILQAGRDVVVNWIECTAVRSGGGSSVRKWQVKPVWLRVNQPRRVQANTSQAWYLTIHVPTDAKAGDYKGTFTLSAEGGGKADFPIQFKVLPFALDKADHVGRGAYVSGPVTDDYVQDMVEHGLNCSSTWQGHLPPRLLDGKCLADTTPAMERYLRQLKQAGFVRMVYFGGGDNRYANPANVPGATKAKVGTPEFEKYYGQYWQDIRRQEKQKGWPEMICCPFDEPVKTPEKIQHYLSCYDAVKKASPETQVFCVFMNRNWAAGRLGRQADIWSCNGAFDAAQAQKKALAEQGVHKLFYTYTGCMANSRPGTVRYNSGFGPWKFDADGVYFWAYLWYAADPFNDLDGAYTDWSPAARDVDGRIYDCVGFEGWREGVDDRRYVETCLRMAREKNRKDVLDEMAELHKGIASGRESQTSARTRGLDDFFFRIDDTNVLDVYRAKVVAMILEMLKAK
ncbi:MAG: hypothetical protein AMJ81_06545 [Phycisphaerae bacterium SM23_33]|jgi:hypothetical protein|nr:MAG: hypothetical protein AMJ81_06545 [Phycisphaerae bacterium SM23_33]